LGDIKKSIEECQYSGVDNNKVDHIGKIIVDCRYDEENLQNTVTSRVLFCLTTFIVPVNHVDIASKASL